LQEECYETDAKQEASNQSWRQPCPLCLAVMNKWTEILGDKRAWRS